MSSPRTDGRVGWVLLRRESPYLLRHRSRETPEPWSRSRRPGRDDEGVGPSRGLLSPVRVRATQGTWGASDPVSSVSCVHAPLTPRSLSPVGVRSRVPPKGGGGGPSDGSVRGWTQRSTEPRGGPRMSGRTTTRVRRTEGVIEHLRRFRSVSTPV